MRAVCCGGDVAQRLLRLQLRGGVGGGRGRLRRCCGRRNIRALQILLRWRLRQVPRLRSENSSPSAVAPARESLMRACSHPLVPSGLQLAVRAHCVEVHHSAQRHGSHHCAVVQGLNPKQWGARTSKS